MRLPSRSPLSGFPAYSVGAGYRYSGDIPEHLAQAGGPSSNRRLAQAELVGHLRVTRMAVSFDLVANQVVVGIRIGGRGPFPCLLDTAAAPSVVDLTLARDLGLRVSDDRPGAAAGQGSQAPLYYPWESTRTFGSVGREVGDVEAVAFDLSRLGAKLNQPLHAILGQSFFEGRVVQIDYPNRRVRLDPPGFERGLRADIEGAADLTPVVTAQVNAASVPLVLNTARA